MNTPLAEQLDWQRFAHVSDWVFDLDNTLYPGACNLFAQIDAKMTDFVARELQVGLDAARLIQKTYYAEHGTTLNGLMRQHGMAPHAFLDYVHDIDLSPLDAAPRLAERIARLPGRKHVYTNGSVGHAQRVCARLGLTDVVDTMFGIAESGFRPKPDPAGYQALFESHAITPTRAVMVEDLARNLVPARAFGMVTVLVVSDHDWSHEPQAMRPAAPGAHPEFVDYVTSDLAHFLDGLHAARQQA